MDFEITQFFLYYITIYIYIYYVYIDNIIYNSAQLPLPLILFCIKCFCKFTIFFKSTIKGIIEQIKNKEIRPTPIICRRIFFGFIIQLTISIRYNTPIKDQTLLIQLIGPEFCIDRSKNSDHSINNKWRVEYAFGKNDPKFYFKHYIIHSPFQLPFSLLLYKYDIYMFLQSIIFTKSLSSYADILL